MKWLCLLLLPLLLSCGSRSNDTPAGDDDTTGSPTGISSPGNISGCYLQVLDGDSVLAQIQERAGGVVEGQLQFNNRHIDGSSGTLSGKREGDILKMVYRFQSEGMQSVMDMYFRINQDRLERATGSMQTIGDSAFFDQPQQLEYGTGTVLRKIDCSALRPADR